MKKFKVQGSRFKVKGDIFLFFLAFLFSVFNFEPSTSYADEITARAVAVINEADGRILYAKNPNLKLPPASTTKLITAMVALERVSPEAIVVISKRAANTPSVSPHLAIGERYTVKDLLYLALMRSVNSAAVALAEAVAGSEDAFVRLMNKKAANLGAKDTRFANSSGLPGGIQHTTAYDLALIMKEAMKNSLIREIINTREKKIASIDGRVMAIKNTNHLLWTDDDNIGGKTGYTRAAGHCLVCAAKKGQSSLITAVLGEPKRERLWDTTNFVLSKGYDVLHKDYQPMVYFSNNKVNDKPNLMASNKPLKTYKKHRKAKGREVKMAKRHNKGKKYANVKIAKKNGARKRSVS